MTSEREGKVWDDSQISGLGHWVDGVAIHWEKEYKKRKFMDWSNKLSFGQCLGVRHLENYKANLSSRQCNFNLSLMQFPDL